MIVPLFTLFSWEERTCIRVMLIPKQDLPPSRGVDEKPDQAPGIVGAVEVIYLM